MPSPRCRTCLRLRRRTGLRWAASRGAWTCLVCIRTGSHSGWWISGPYLAPTIRLVRERVRGVERDIIGPRKRNDRRRTAAPSLSGGWLATITSGAVWTPLRAPRSLLTLFMTGGGASAGARSSTVARWGHTLCWALLSRRRCPTRGSASRRRMACVPFQSIQRLLEAWHSIVDEVTHCTDIRTLLLLRKRCAALVRASREIASLRRSSGAVGVLPRPRAVGGAIPRIACAILARVSFITGAFAIKIARAGVLFWWFHKRGGRARAARSLQVTVAVSSLSRPLAKTRISTSTFSRRGAGAIPRGRTKTLTAPLPSSLSLRRGRARRARVGGARSVYTLPSLDGRRKSGRT